MKNSILAKSWQILLVIVMILTLFGCSDLDIQIESSTQATLAPTDNPVLTPTPTLAPTIYSPGDMVTISTEMGTYIFTVVEVKLLPPYSDARPAVYQVVYQYENIDFGAGEQIFLYIDENDLQVKDDQGFVLSPMHTAWNGDWMESKNLVPSEKCLSKMTYTIINDSSQYLDITFGRLKEQNAFFRVPITN